MYEIIELKGGPIRINKQTGETWGYACDHNKQTWGWQRMNEEQDILRKESVRKDDTVGILLDCTDARKIQRICDIVLNNSFGNKELDSLALDIAHHPDILNA
jgi:hypothetical protein